MADSDQMPTNPYDRRLLRARATYNTTHGTLLEHAGRLLRTGTMDGFAVKDLAAVSGMSPSTVYNHFPNGPDDIMSEMFDQMLSDAYTVGRNLNRRPTETSGAALAFITRSLIDLGDGGRYLLRRHSQNAPQDSVPLEVGLARIMRASADGWTDQHAVAVAQITGRLWRGAAVSWNHSGVGGPWEESPFAVSDTEFLRVAEHAASDAEALLAVSQ